MEVGVGVVGEAGADQEVAPVDAGEVHGLGEEVEAGGRKKNRAAAVMKTAIRWTNSVNQQEQISAMNTPEDSQQIA